MSEQAPRTDSSIARSARTAARRLTPEYGPDLIVEVEKALRPGNRADQYLDPVTLGSLIVSAASLGWTIYRDLRARKAKGTRELMAQRIRVELPTNGAITPAQRDQTIEVVIEQIINEDGE